ncbi:uncharacterized protein LOC112500109 [Cynara cardunculus var. scolymus]|uniref:UBZ4-type domain-containing protein n=1 Tax=Cynara cardunculus var. scolymus TaxID=59895 RepID=A0A103Y4J7_CYNCS|nr:uncharacterized protein LOC112500109 [Cynara cardunculus var. scolymus]KVI02392.1 hypothetical protein Ccrd_019343 [Cynara cardunculus var. scolymus]
MISIDDHPPPDPSSSDHQNHHQQKEVSHELKINNGEKAPASVSNIDLLKPKDSILDDTKNPLPNFSIRDYVFGSRCKDIASNWPFSQEILQLCLQYGVKNLLPPFQPLDLLISNPNQSGSRCAVENRLPDEEILSSSEGKFSIEPQCHLEKDLAHTKSKKSHPASSEKTSNTTNQTAVKKYKFFMKLNSGVERVDQEVTPNNFIVSETMLAAKVCPVCKTFSSSSNTTLNAHIDRCLSEESSMKWTTNPKIIVKHRIKPRKTRLMVDIYKTAPCCTVEELDRRNGTSWATNSNFPDQELEFQAEEKKKESRFVPEATGHDGTVYIDTNGTKVRILSMPKVGTIDDHEARKLQKGGKGSKITAEKKKKKAYRQKNRDKMFKLSPNSKKFCSLKPHHPVSEAIGGQEEDVAIEERCDKPMKARENKQMEDLAITRPPLACSKRTHLTKKRRSTMLTKPKEGFPLQDSYEDPLGIRSKGGKFSSLQDNPSSTSQECNAGSKFNPKRKFSHCLSKENAVMEPSQDSSKQKSRIEEDTSENLSFEIVNVLEAKRKKSVTSKITANGYSSQELEIAFVDPLLDVESATADEIPSHSDVQERSFMGLRNSFDDQFSKMVSRVDNKFDIDKIMIEHNAEDCMDDIEKEGNYFHEIDPIPIPGPPGSFLPPSPGGDMVSEELQGNSSLTTTSRFQSSEEQYHHDHMLDSPISTVSSSSLARSDDKLSVGFASLRDTNLSFTNVVIDVVDQKSSSVNASNSRSVDAIFKEKGLTPSGFQNHEQPCVCSRKEGVLSKNVPSYHQESAILTEGAFESNKRPELFSLIINHPELPSPLPPETVKPLADPSVKLPFYRDFESVVRPTTPVLRLMGKNLTVVKTDDDHQLRTPFCSNPFGHQQLHNIQNNDHTSFFHGYLSDQKPVIFNHNQNDSKSRHFNVHPPRNLADLRLITAPTTDCNRLDVDNNEEKSPWKATKEIIVIDDSSENEADARIMLQERMRRNHHLFDGGVSSAFHHGSFGASNAPYPR